MYSIIVPTIGNKENELIRLFESLLEQEGEEMEVILAVQDNFISIEKIADIYKKQLTIKTLKLNRKGLSYARNKALEHIEGSILVFSDDDCWYPSGIFKKVKESIYKNEISTFQIYDPDHQEYYKNYSNLSCNHRSILKTFKVSSIEIFINLNKVSKQDIVFDESFGLGAKYPGAEEINLLLDFIKRGFTLTYINEIAVYHRVFHRKENPVIDSKVLEVKGAFLRRNFNTFLFLFFGLGFYIKKFKLIKNKGQSLTALLKGYALYNKNNQNKKSKGLK